eukprot:CAMPEP_0202963460 /NCGR_PEP_ID=MMETSP1396-20130829/7445_1 /ASSEMBLY_ACC=CAM_ASM_000872 /TAXON_ID= /ORGANISM="Pseudokeronopsis sp., Strain Brazil" /LENGTH=69 /DNA_ID=CAMNT_0049684677 /DNA_START=383 /DNA_END=592 /DNA_ORIENTATION=-
MELVEGLQKLLKALKEIVQDKLPDLAAQASRLPEEAEDVKNRAEPEFERLGLMEKAKAVSALASNIKTL